VFASSVRRLFFENPVSNETGFFVFRLFVGTEIISALSGL
jgi:hypothetical protein